MRIRPVFFLTDFGLSDPFVGVMKAIVCRLAPGAPLIDLTHLIPPQDVLTAAVALEDAFPHLPPGAVVCAVVDPGVGSNRRAVAADANGRLLVGPDNGIFTPMLRRAHRVISLQPGEHIRPNLSHTFHGRDVFAPAAGLLARGDDLESLGDPIDDWVHLAYPAAEERRSGELHLCVLAIDHFGNMALNVTLGESVAHWPWVVEKPIHTQAGNSTIQGLSRTFADVESGQPLVYWNSAGRLEIALRDGNAANALGLIRGDTIVVSCRTT